MENTSVQRGLFFTFRLFPLIRPGLRPVHLPRRGRLPPGGGNLPLSGELIPHPNGQQPLVYPIYGISFFQIGHQGSVNGLFRVDGFFDPLPADLGKPELERLCFGGRDRLN